MPLHGAHLVVEVQHFGAARVGRRHAFDHREQYLYRIELESARSVACSKPLRHVRDPSHLLAYAFEEIAVRDHVDDVEAETAEVEFVEIAIEAGRIVVGGKMRENSRTAP